MSTPDAPAPQGELPAEIAEAIAHMRAMSTPYFSGQLLDDAEQELRTAISAHLATTTARLAAAEARATLSRETLERAMRDSWVASRHCLNGMLVSANLDEYIRRNLDEYLSAPTDASDTQLLDFMDEHAAAVEVADDEVGSITLLSNLDFEINGYSNERYDIRTAIRDAMRKCAEINSPAPETNHG